MLADCVVGISALAIGIAGASDILLLRGSRRRRYNDGAGGGGGGAFGAGGHGVFLDTFVPLADCFVWISSFTVSIACTSDVELNGCSPDETDAD
jgi:hypothetical protein